MMNLSWIEILLCITAVTVLVKVIKDRYDEKYGDK